MPVRQEQSQSLTYPRCYIQAGYVTYSTEPACICGVCGNGVIVTLYDPANRCGGMAHCVFPELGAKQKPSNYHSFTALTTLYTHLSRRHRLSRRLEAQLFGGGSYHGLKKERADRLTRRLQAILNRMNAKIVSMDTGGTLGRKVVFNTLSGETLVYKTRNVRKTDWMPEFPRK